MERGVQWGYEGIRILDSGESEITSVNCMTKKEYGMMHDDTVFSNNPGIRLKDDIQITNFRRRRI